MKICRVVVSGAAMVVLLMGTANAATYDCTVEVPKALYRTDYKAELKAINSAEFWAGKLDFEVAIKPGSADELDIATVIWPSDPINVEGQFPAVRIAKDVVAFGAYSSGPCLFTEAQCLAQFQISDQANETAKVLILPTALWTDDQADTREPFVNVIEGTCTKGKS